MWPLAMWHRMRSSLWGLPLVAVVVSAGAGLFLARYEVPPGSPFSWLAYDGGVAGARSVLQVISGSTITVVSLVFSLTVVALQMAASQYSPRLLHGFVRDLANQLTLAVFLSTFMFSLVVLPSVRAAGEDTGTYVPDLAVTIALIMATASVGALVLFIHHVTRSLRIEAIMRRVRDDTLASIERNTGKTVPGWADADKRLSLDPGDGMKFPAPQSGYVRSIDIARLVDVGCRHDVRIRFRRTIGEYVAEGTVLAWIVTQAEEAIHAEALEDVERTLEKATRISFERAMDEDVGFGLRQLIDIAVKALSPGVNDPTTAVDAIGHLSVVLQTLAQRPLGAETHRDGDRVVVEVPRPTFSDYLGIAISPIAHYGATDVTVLRRLLRVLEDLAPVTEDDGRREAIDAAAGRILEVGRRGLDPGRDCETLEEGVEHVREALKGEVRTSEYMIL